jgi:hypothetical protein
LLSVAGQSRRRPRPNPPAPSVSLVSLGGHGLSTPFLCFPLSASRALTSSCFFACSMSDDTGGQDGLRRGGRPSSAARSMTFVDRRQPTIRARPPLVPIRAPAHRQGGGFKEFARIAPSYAAGASACSLVVQRNSVPSSHIRCKTTASLRARATLASLAPLLFAIRIAQLRNPDQRP